MALQFIQDVKGNTTGVFIPIEEWQDLKSKYSDLQIQEIAVSTHIPLWQKQIIDNRLNDYHNNADDLADFDETLNSIEKAL